MMGTLTRSKLNIRQVKHLTQRLRVTIAELTRICDALEAYCEELELIDPAGVRKSRTVFNIRGPARRLQEAMLRRILLPALSPSDYSFGGVHGRHIKMAVLQHAHSIYAFVTDISNFYPSIGHQRVYRLFENALGCSPDVARYCTRLCTYRGHLALGLMTSPILADQILRPIDERIAGMCERRNLIYTRFVDDVAISGNYDLVPAKSSVSELLCQIFSNHGFQISTLKHKWGRLEDDIEITKLRIVRGRPDVSAKYMEKVLEQIAVGRRLAAGEFVSQVFHTETQVRGRIEFICWIRPGRRRELMAAFRSVNWTAAQANATAQGLLIPRRLLRRKREEPSTTSELLRT